MGNENEDFPCKVCGLAGRGGPRGCPMQFRGLGDDQRKHPEGCKLGQPTPVPDPRLAALEGQNAVLRVTLTDAFQFLGQREGERTFSPREIKDRIREALSSTGSEAGEVLAALAKRRATANNHDDLIIHFGNVDDAVGLGEALARFDDSARKGGENGRHLS